MHWQRETLSVNILRPKFRTISKSLALSITNHCKPTEEVYGNEFPKPQQRGIHTDIALTIIALLHCTTAAYFVHERDNLPTYSFLTPDDYTPGMMLLPGSFSGRDSSPRPHRGPEARNLNKINFCTTTLLMKLKQFFKGKRSSLRDCKVALGSSCHYLPIYVIAASASHGLNPKSGLKPPPDPLGRAASNAINALRWQ